MKWSNIINSFLLYVIFVILILVTVGVIKTETKVDDKQKALQTTIDSLRSEIDTLQVERQKYDEEIISLQDSVVRVCFQPSATGTIVDKYYQVLAVNANTDVERDSLTFTLASLDNLPIRLDSTLLAVLDTDTLG